MTLWNFMAGLTTIPDSNRNSNFLLKNLSSNTLPQTPNFHQFCNQTQNLAGGGKVEYKSNSGSSALILLFPFPSNTDLDPLISMFFFQKTIYSGTSLRQILSFNFSFIHMIVISPFLRYLTILSKNPSNPYFLCQC